MQERGAVALGGVGTLLVLLRLFVPSSVGLADNGDGPRLMCRFGLSPHTEGVNLYNDYAIFRYDYSGCRPPVEYPSSSHLLISIDKFFSQLLGLPGVDLRVMAVLYALLAGLLIAFAVRLLRSPAPRLIVAVALTLVLADAAFADYMASPFTETSAILGIFILTVAGLYVCRAGPARVISLVFFTLGGALTVTAKVQNITLVIPIVVFLLAQLFRQRANKGLLKSTTTGALLILSVVAVVGAAQWTYSNNPKDFAMINPTDVIFVSLLGPSDDPRGDLRQMGLPVELAKYQGHTWYKDGPQQDPSFVTVQDQMTYRTAGRFYLSHPSRAFTTANTAANDFFKSRPAYLGTYGVGSGTAAQLECRVCVVSGVVGLLSGTGIIGLAGVWIGLAFAASRGVLRRRRDVRSPEQPFRSVALMLVGIAVAAFVTASFGESTETTKHLVFAILATALAAVCCIAPVFSPLHVLGGGTSEGVGDHRRPAGRHRGSVARAHLSLQHTSRSAATADIQQ